MFNYLPLCLVLSLASAVPMDFLKPQPVFGIPSDVLTPTLDLEQVQRAPSTVEDHVRVGAEDDHGLFRKLWEHFLPKMESLRWPETEDLLDDGGDYTQDSMISSLALKLPEIKYKEHEVFPDFKIVKFELPPLPEVKPLDLPKLPELEWPEIKVVKLELPPLPEIKSLDLPKLPELELPEVKVIKYELPPLPEWKLPELPKWEPLEFPDFKIVKYELPSIPDMKPLDFPPLPNIELPDIQLVKYELPLPPMPEATPLDLPEIKLPDLKIVKLELPRLPELKPIKFQDLSSVFEVKKVKLGEQRKEVVEAPEVTPTQQDLDSDGSEMQEETNSNEKTEIHETLAETTSEEPEPNPEVLTSVEPSFNFWPASGMQLPPFYPAYPLPVHYHGIPLQMEPVPADFWTLYGGDTEPGNKAVRRKSSKLWDWNKENKADFL